MKAQVLVNDLRFDPDGSWLAATTGPSFAHLWDLKAPQDAEPLDLVFRFLWVHGMFKVFFHPDANWIATTNLHGVTIWPFGRPYPKILRHMGPVPGACFDPGGEWVASVCMDRVVRLWDLSGESPARTWSLGGSIYVWGMTVDPKGKLLATWAASGVSIIRVDGDSVRKLPGVTGAVNGCAFDPEGRLLAVSANFGDASNHVIRVYDLETDEFFVLDAEDGRGSGNLTFDPLGRLLCTSGGALRRWDLKNETYEVLLEKIGRFDLSNDGRSLVGVHRGQAFFYDLEKKERRELPLRGEQVKGVALDPTGTVAFTSESGALSVGPVTGGEPHLLLGQFPINANLAVHPSGKWIASGSGGALDGDTLRLWPVPEGRPFHTLPYEEFLDRLRALTNLRAEPSEESVTGYEIAVGEFPGWEKLPTW
jgi:WD40 repeat protein